MVYEKSTLGFMEFTTDKRTLGVRERQVLLLVNGVRTLDDLEKFFKKDHLQETLKKLENEGYIQRPIEQRTPEHEVQQQQHSLQTQANSAFSVTLSFLDVTENAATICPKKLAAVKSILIDAADDYLGIMGRSIKSRIEACDSEDSLRQCISSWHMAMRESKLGRESASFLMEQIHYTMEETRVTAANQRQSQY